MRTKGDLASLEMTRAMTQYLEDRVVAIVLDSQQSPRIGTGTCIQVGERFFVATAAHVLTGHGAGEIRLVTQRDEHDGLVEIVGMGRRGGGEYDKVDIAWIELDPRSAARLPKKFIQVHSLRPYCRHLDSDLVFLLGFPSARVVSERMPDGRQWLDFQPVGRTTLEFEEQPVIGRDEYDFFLRYPDRGVSDMDGKPVAASDPHGVSGATVWAVEINEHRIWLPERARVIGIQHSWSRGKWLRATQVQHWLRLLSEDVPQLRPLIDPILAVAAPEPTPT